MSRRHQTGQSLLIAVMIFMVLLTSVPAIVFLNRMSGRHGTSTVKSQKALSVAHEGATYAMHLLSSDAPTWKAALAGTCPAEFMDGGAPRVYTGISGGVYTIECVSGAPLENYQVQVTVLGYAGAQPNKHDTRIVQTVFSQRTVAAVLPNQIRAGAALMLLKTPCQENLPGPAGSGGLTVHWGPIAVLDGFQWTARGPMDTFQFPRKFCQGDITDVTGNNRSKTTSATPAKDTDHQEYWANSRLDFPNVIDLAGYKVKAQNSVVTPPTCLATGAPCAADPLFPNGGYFPDVGTDTAIFDAYTLNSPDKVIYVEGNVEIRNVTIDLKNTTLGTSGALIVAKHLPSLPTLTGNLTFGDPGTGSGQTLALRIPPTADQEYPYITAATPNPPSWPCQSAWSPPIPAAPGGAGSPGGGTCNSPVTKLGRGDLNGLGTSLGDGQVQIRGFIYAQGNFVSNPGGTNKSTLIDGVMRVDGFFNASGPDIKLSVLYDDEINRSINVLPNAVGEPIELVIDSQKVIAAP